MDAGAEIQRLESNHAELLLHQETLATQLQTKKDQLKQIRTALADCRELLTSHDEELQNETDTHEIHNTTSAAADASDVVMTPS